MRHWTQSWFPRLVVILLTLLTVLMSSVASRVSALTEMGPGDADEMLYQAVLPSEREAVYAETAGRLSRYRYDATFSPFDGQLATITGTLDLRFYNGSGTTLDDIYFRLYPNDQEYAEGELTLDAVTVEGEAVTPRLQVGRTVARIGLDDALPAGEAIDLALSFTTTIPNEPRESYGMFSHNLETGTYALAHWGPLLAGYGEGDGWELAPPSNLGDPVFTNAALFDVSLTVPDDLLVMATGEEIATDPADEGWTTHRYVSGPVRDFVIAIDDDLQEVTETVDGTTVRSWFSAEHEELGKEVLRFGVQSLEVFEELFGPYPYTEMEIVEVDLQRALGVEFAQITYIEEGLYDQGTGSRRDARSLEFTLVHEMAHQWWYGLVGNNQYQHAFIDEGLTNYVSTVYMREIYGDNVADQQVDRNLKYWYLATLFAGEGDFVANQPTEDFPSANAYGATIYGKAALGFADIHDEIGSDAFFAALTDYTARHRFQVATPEDLLAAFERAADRDLSDLWDHWFNETNGTQDFTVDDLERLRQEFGG